MVKFDLKEILNDTNFSLDLPLDEICKLADILAAANTSYVGNTRNLTIGKKPSEGLLVSQLPETDKTYSYILDKYVDFTEADYCNLEKIYSDNVFKALIATGTIPLGWLYNNDPSIIKHVYDRLKFTWDCLVLNNSYYEILYPHFTSFGLLTKRVQGHTKEDLCFYCIYTNETERTFLLRFINSLKVKNLIIMTEKEYSETLANDVYTYLVKFNKVVSPYTGISFKAVTKLKESIPDQLLEVGCDSSVILINDDVKTTSAYPYSNNPRYCVKKFKRGESVAMVVRIPSNYQISFISLNGTNFFNGTADMEAAGISIVELNVTTLTVYKTFEITVSGLVNNSSIYISSCEDLTGKISSKNMISPKSAVSVSDNDVTMYIVFNKPFIYLDTSKIRVWAKKDDETDKELVTNATFLISGQSYVERNAVFQMGRPGKKPSFSSSIMEQNVPRPECDFEGRPHMGNNPYIFDNFPYRGNKPVSIPTEDPKSDRVMIYGVVECGSLMVMFDGYTDYKYFCIEFEDRAMIANLRIPGTSTIVDVIPVIEKKVFNTKPEEDEIPPEEETPGDDSDDEPPIDSGNGDDVGGEDVNEPETPPEEDTPTDDNTNSGEETKDPTESGVDEPNQEVTESETVETNQGQPTEEVNP